MDRAPAGTVRRLRCCIRARFIPLLCLLAAIATLAERIRAQFSFVWQYTDQDQTLMWAAVREFSAFRFHEPCFYGQNYNSMVEALLAAPLYYLGLSAPAALGIVTSLMALSPFWWFAHSAWKKKEQGLCLLILLLPLTLPTDYTLITAMPRGFITGICMAALGCYLAEHSRGKYAPLSLGFSAVAALWLNPNSVLLLAAPMLKMLLDSGHRLRTCLYLSIGALPAAGWYYYAWHFYYSQPEYMVFKGLDTEYQLSLVWQGLQSLDSYFDALSPGRHNGALWMLFSLGTLCILAFRQQQTNMAVGILLSLLISILSLGITKLHDADPSILFAKARMFLAFPVLLAWGMAQLSANRYPQKWVLGIALLAGGMVLYKHLQYEGDLIRLRNTPSKVMRLQRMDDLRISCKQLSRLCKQLNASLILSQYRNWEEMYGCGAIFPDFPQTLLLAYERRTWRYQEEHTRIHRGILLLGTPGEAARTALQGPLKARKLYSPLFYTPTDVWYIPNNQRSTPELIRALGVAVRWY